jgi:hypothetical protein
LDYFERHLAELNFRFCNFVDFPAHMSPQNLPTELKATIVRRLEPYLGRYPEIAVYLKHMQERDLWPEQGPVLLRYLDDLTAARGLDWRVHFADWARAL